MQVVDEKGSVIAATANMHDDDNAKFRDPVLEHPPESRRTAISTLTELPMGPTGSFRILAKPVTLPQDPG